MYEVYNSSIYNQYLKGLRKEKGLTIEELAKITHLSAVTIGLFENSDNLLENKRLEFMEPFYGFKKDELINFDKQITENFKLFTHNVIYDNSQLAELYYNSIINVINEFKDSIFTSILPLIQLIYTLYTYTNSATLDMNVLNQNKTYYSTALQSLCSTYQGHYHVFNKDYKTAKQYFDEASYYITKDSTFENMYHYFMSTYCMRTNDIFGSISHYEKAIAIFSKNQNFIRIINLNILVANQYLKMKNYPKALELNIKNLENASQNNLIYEAGTASNNITFIYIMQSHFDKAIPYFKQMDFEFMKEHHYYAYMISLVEENKLEEAYEIMLKGKNIATTPYYIYFYKCYEKYFTNNNLKQLSRNIEKVFTKFDDFLDPFEKEFICVLLINQFKRSHNTKKALEYYEKLHEFIYCN